MTDRGSRHRLVLPRLDHRLLQFERDLHIHRPREIGERPQRQVGLSGQLPIDQRTMYIELGCKFLLRELAVFLPLRKRLQQFIPDATNETTRIARPAPNIKLKGRHLDLPPEHIKYDPRRAPFGVF